MIQPLKKMVYFQACDGRNGIIGSLLTLFELDS